MPRDVQIPLALWVCAAIVAHFAGGGSAVVGTQAAERLAAERAEILEAVRGVRREIRGGDGTLEVEMINLPPPELPAPPPDPESGDASADAADEVAPSPDDPKRTDEKKAKDPTEREPEKKAPTPAPPTIALPQLVPPPPPPPAPPPPPPEPAAPDTPRPPLPEPPPNDGRIAVEQHVPKDQEDNPEANRIADEANHEREETMARERSFDQDHADPTPGTNNRGPADKVGNDESDKVAHAEEKEGDKTKAPGEAAPASAPTHSAPPPAAPANADRPSSAGGAGAPGTPGPADQPRGASVADPGNAGGTGPASPDVVSSERGGYTLDPTNPGGDGRTANPGAKRKPSPFSTRIDVRALGLGGSGLPGGPAMNLTQDLVERAVGADKLAAERASAGAALRSRRTGRLDTNKFERWRPAIENYDPSVKLGNQTSLNAARKVYAGFLNHVHNRIHPVFAEEFLDSLDRISKKDALNDAHMIAHVEIVLRKEDGSIARMGITRNSGSTVFDAASLEAIQRASPFGRPPDPIVSPDGLVYLHWEFHRDPHDACSSRNARPYLLASAAPSGPAAPRRPVPPPAPTEGIPPRRGPAGSPRPGAPRAPSGPAR